MKRLFTVALFICFLPLLLWAKPVTQTEARNAALNWIAASGAFGSNAAIAEVLAVERNGLILYYACNVLPEGFILIAGDDVAAPVLGYGTTGRVDPERTVQGFNYLMEKYEDELRTSIQQNLVPTQRIAQEWDVLKKEPGTVLRKVSQTTIGPFISTNWGQDNPYNVKVPNLGCSNRGVNGNQYALTGCVATTMSQIMRYYAWPERGQGSFHGVSFDVAYNWGSMPNTVLPSSSQTEIDAVSTIMYHSGIAANMRYGCDVSLSRLDSALIGLENYFQYHTDAELVFRGDFTPTNWHNLLKGDLDAARPFIYGGSSQSMSGGHAWAIDGYTNGPTTTLYHCNWGWDGYLNGFFALDSLTPTTGADFNYYQHAIVHLRPATNPSVLATSMTMWLAPGAGGISPVIQAYNAATDDTSDIEYSIVANQGWINLSQDQGLTPDNFTITVSPNATGSIKYGVVTLTPTHDVGSLPVTISVVQPPLSGGVPILSASPTTVTIGAGGGLSQTISIINADTQGSLKIDFVVNETTDWFSTSIGSGATSATMTVNAQQNTSGETRTGVIVITPTTPGVSSPPVRITVIQTASTQPYLSVTPLEIVLPQAGGTSSSVSIINASTANPSSISYTITESLAWLTASVASGATPGSFTVTAPANTSGLERSGTVRIAATSGGVDNSPVDITVRQLSGTSAPVLTVSPLLWSAPAAGGTSSAIQVTNSNTQNSTAIQCSITVSASWLIPSAAGGVTPGTFTITADANQTGSPRTGTVTVTAITQGVSGSPQVITVTQAASGSGGQYTLSASLLAWSPPATSSQSPLINITNSASSLPITFTVQSSASWLTATPSGLTTPATLSLTTTPNPGNPRVGTVTITATTAGVTGSPWVITVTQAGGDASTPILSVSQTAVNFTSTGGISSAIQTTNSGSSTIIAYTVISSATWLTPSTSSGSTPGSFTLTASSNLTGQTRTTSVTVTATTQGVQGSPQTVSVTQDGLGTTGPALATNTAELLFNASGGTSGAVQITNPSTANPQSVPYTIMSSASWAGLSAANGSTPGVLTVTVQPNASSSERTATITITASISGVSGSPVTITVRQIGKTDGFLSTNPVTGRAGTSRVRPGDVVWIPLSLTSDLVPQSGTQSGIELSFIVHYDVFALYPLRVQSLRGSPSIERIAPNAARIRLRNAVLTTGELLRVQMEVLLGMTDTTSWRLSTPALTGTSLTVAFDSSAWGFVQVNARNGIRTRDDLGIPNLSPGYPNPAVSQNTITFTVSLDADATVDARLYNMLGVEMRQVFSGDLPAGDTPLTINVGDLQPGAYNLLLRTASGSTRRSFVVAK